MAALSGSFGKVEHSALLNHHAAAQRQAYSAAAALGGEEWDEGMVEDIGRHATAVVVDTDY